MKKTEWMDPEVFAAERKRRVEVFEDTRRRFREDNALWEKTKRLVEDAELYLEGFDAPARTVKSSDGGIEVVEDTTFHCASIFARRYRTAVLDFASATTPGGGVLYGARAQEECLCRCSNLYFVLEDGKFWEEYYGWNHMYPQERGSNRIIYSRDVTVIKDDSPFPEPLKEADYFDVDVITCAAPKLRDWWPISDVELLQLHIRRGRNILESAIANDVDVLVLGAFGCGAFSNPPTIVASAMRTLLVDLKYARYFRKVIFAIKKNHSDNGNYAAFREVFEGSNG